MSKNIETVIFYILVGIFSICYWSFFPGGYTYDTYISYLNSLGLFQYLEVVPPIYAVNWKLLNNYNFAPLLINYLIFIIALVLSIKFTKSYRIAIFSLIGICLPYTLITYICAWKDNSLLSILFLTTILCLNKNRSILYNVIVIALFFTACSVRLNAVFAVIPLLYYFLHDRKNRLKSITVNTQKRAYEINYGSDKYSRLKTLALTIVLIIGFQIINKGLNKFVFHAEVQQVEQTIMFTDIAKINYLQQKNVTDDIPEAFLRVSNLDDENIDKIFGVYFNHSCNDWLYMYPETEGAKAILQMSNNEDAVKQLKSNWVKKIVKNPFSYLRARCSQLNNALWLNNTLYTEPMLDFNEGMFNRIAGGEEKTKNFDRESKVFRPMTNTIAVSIRGFYIRKSAFLDVISSAGLHFILSIIMLIIFFINRRKNRYFRLGMYLSLSGVLYIVGYIPWLPCTDHRYFIWTVFSFWFSVGVFVLAMLRREGSEQTETVNSNLPE